MTNEATAQVSGAENAGAAAATQANAAPSGGGTANAAPANAPADARQPGQPVDWAARAKSLEGDISRLKSTYDSRLSQVERQHQAALQAMQQRLAEVETRGMTDEQRKQYEAARQSQTLSELQRQNEILQQQLAQASQREQYIAHYAGLGVPREALERAQTLEQLSEIGWTAIRERLQAQPAGNGTATPAQSEQTPPEPPAVVTATHADAPANSWAALRKATGMIDEDIYRAVEVGQLDPSVIPAE